MTNIVWTNKQPKEEGFYLFHRTDSVLCSPMLITLRWDWLNDKELWLIGGGNCFPLKRLKREKGIKYSQRLHLGKGYPDGSI
jgi:hypothetical protein